MVTEAPISPTQNLIFAPIINPDGSLNQTALQQQYGLGIAEANQLVKFGSYEGTVAQMLSDAKCPIAGRLSTVYAEGKIEGVRDYLNDLSKLDPSFRVEITEQTWGQAQHQTEQPDVKKK